MMSVNSTFLSAITNLEQAMPCSDRNPLRGFGLNKALATPALRLDVGFASQRLLFL